MPDANAVIVVDDDKAVAASLKFSLELDGLAVHACGDGRDVLDYPGLGAAACLVVDYRMPGMDGFNLKKALGARGIAAPAILITATVSLQLRRRAQEAGFFAILEKPLLDNVLLDNVRAAMAAA